MYSVGIDRRSLARLAGSINSRTVAINSSVVSGVNEASPSSGQTQAGMLGIRIETPSSIYSKVAGPQTLGVLCSPQIGTGWFDMSLTISFPFCAGKMADHSIHAHPGMYAVTNSM